MGEPIIPKVYQQAMSLMNKRQIDLQSRINTNKQRAHKFKESGNNYKYVQSGFDLEKMSEINRENMKILNKLVEISKGKLSTYGQKKRSQTNTSFYKSQFATVSLHEKSSIQQYHPQPHTSMGNYSSHQVSPRIIIHEGGSGSQSYRQQQQIGNTSIYSTGEGDGTNRETSPQTSPRLLPNNNDITLHFFARKREFERIDIENKRIKKQIDDQKPCMSIKRMEEDFKHHIKIRSLIKKSNGIRPIESFMRKRKEIVNAILPPLSQESPTRYTKRNSPSHRQMNQEYMPKLYDSFLYEDPHLMQFYEQYRQGMNQAAKEIRAEHKRSATVDIKISPIKQIVQKEEIVTSNLQAQSISDCNNEQSQVSRDKTPKSNAQKSFSHSDSLPPSKLSNYPQPEPSNLQQSVPEPTIDENKSTYQVQAPPLPPTNQILQHQKQPQRLSVKQKTFIKKPEQKQLPQQLNTQLTFKQPPTTKQHTFAFRTNKTNSIAINQDLAKVEKPIIKLQVTKKQTEIIDDEEVINKKDANIEIQEKPEMEENTEELAVKVQSDQEEKKVEGKVETKLEEPEREVEKVEEEYDLEYEES